ncbi:MAG: methyltetrahydrofolate cobalamin methyltransferase, partial [Candidatus Ratteibacteria bacterium]
FVDCLVEPVSCNTENPIIFLKALKEVKKFKVKTTCGLSNVSFGLPNRKIVNKYFLALCIYEGLDSAIIDPTIPDIREAIILSEMLTGKDDYCMNYIRSIKEGYF